jgi:5'-3' exonuclease
MKLLLVDLSAVFWRAYHATKDQQVNESFSITVNTINARRHSYEHCAVCCDHGPYKRKAISPEYKAQRDVPDPIAVGQLRRVKERLESDGVLLWDAEGFESDDLIATACHQLTQGIGDESDLSIDILTADKDLYALISDRVTIVRLDSGDRHGPDECLAKLGVRPEQVSELLALTGDSSDNIEGCHGVGPKTAAKLLAENGNLAQIVGDESKLLATGKLRENLIASRDKIKLAHRLVTLMTDAPIDVKELFQKREQKPLTESITDEGLADMDDFDGDKIQDEARGAALQEPPPEPQNVHSIELSRQDNDAIAKTVEKAVIAGPFETSLEPRNPLQAWTLARGIHSSRLFQCESPEAALMILMTGREMGIGAMSSMRGFHFVKGRPVMSSQLMSALILRSGKAEYWELLESDAKHATYATKRVGGRNEQKKTFTLEEARLAQLVKADGNWAKYPTSMCEARAAAMLARIVYPDLLMGVYLPDELDD